MLVVYETPDPSGRKVVPATGGVQFIAKGVAVGVEVMVEDCPKQIGFGLALLL
jgi:hypothetical protein